MFTGLIEEIGTIGTIQPIPGGKKIQIVCNDILDDIKVDDSVSVSGVCLTATAVNDSGFRADAVGETLNKSVLSNIKSGSYCNLERALRLNDRLGGHLVQGHVNGIAEISRITKLGDNYALEVVIPAELQRYVIDEGSIALNGISLTIAKVEGSRLRFSVIPHTWKNTTLQYLNIGDRLNVETDVLAKYIEKLMTDGAKAPGVQNKANDITEEWLKNKGF